MTFGPAYKCDRCKKVAFSKEDLTDWLNVHNINAYGVDGKQEGRHYCSSTCAWMGESDLVNERNKVVCPRHGGEWGADATCVECVDADGNVRPVPNA